MCWYQPLCSDTICPRAASHSHSQSLAVVCNSSRLVAVVKVISERLSFDSLIYFDMSDNINTDANREEAEYNSQ